MNAPGWITMEEKLKFEFFWLFNITLKLLGLAPGVSGSLTVTVA